MDKEREIRQFADPGENERFWKRIDFFKAVIIELNDPNIDLSALAGFVYGKYLSSYSYRDTPKLIAECWLKCNVADNIKKLLETVA